MTVFAFTRVMIWFLLSGLVLITGYQLLSGKINTRLLLHAKVAEGQYQFSPDRVQLLLFTITGAFYYFNLILNNIRSGNLNLPEAPPELLVALGASHLLYLGSKAHSLLRQAAK